MIADNGSTDGSLAFARDWAKLHDNVQVVDASGLAGASAARNAGVEVARGEYLAFCDADDVVLAGWLSACVTALRTADLAAGRFDFWSLNSIPPAAPVRAATRQLGFLPAGLGANLAVRRCPFTEVGGFDEQFVPPVTVRYVAPPMTETTSPLDEYVVPPSEPMVVSAPLVVLIRTYVLPW